MSPARPSASPTSPFRFFHVTVAAVRDVTPSMRRFTFIGDDLVHYADPGWDQRIKLVLPAPTSGYKQLPDGEDWYGRLMKLPEEHRCPIRTYTTRTVRHEAEVPDGTRAEVDVDMVVHDSLGPASRWILEAEVGTEAVLLGPNRQWDGDAGGVDFVPPQVTERYLLGGDETAAPAIARILEACPRARGESPSSRCPVTRMPLTCLRTPGSRCGWLGATAARTGSCSSRVYAGPPRSCVR